MTNNWTIELAVKPFSINAMYYSHRQIKTQEARKWSYEVFSQLDSPKNLKIMSQIRESFNKKEHFFHIDLTAFYPKKRLLTKAGEISAKSIDLTNWEKPIVDLLFLPKHQINSAPFGVQNIGVDDKYICSMSSQKVAWNGDFKIQFVIKLKNIQDLYQTPEHDQDKSPALSADISTPLADQAVQPQ